MKKYNRALCLILITTLIMILMTGCGKEKGIELTLDNYENYLTIVAKCYSHESWSSYNHEWDTMLFSSVDVYGASSNFNYEDVTITVVIVADIDYDKNHYFGHYNTILEIPYTLKVNVGGNASGSNDWLWSAYTNDVYDIVRLNDATYYVKDVKGKVVPVK